MSIYDGSVLTPVDREATKAAEFRNNYSIDGDAIRRQVAQQSVPVELPQHRRGTRSMMLELEEAELRAIGVALVALNSDAHLHLINRVGLALGWLLDNVEETWR